MIPTDTAATDPVNGSPLRAPFDRSLLDALLTMAAKGCADLTEMQKAALSS